MIVLKAYYEERANVVEQVQSHIVELGTIFNRLATVIKTQEEAVNRIDDNAEETTQRIEMGQLALQNTLQNLTSNRALATRLVGILVVFVLIFVIFIA